MPTETKSRWRAFWDWFVLFSGISTASNLSRTRPDPVRRRGLFLFRGNSPKEALSPRSSALTPQLTTEN